MLHYERGGTGQPLVLVHGYLGSLHIFDEVISKLREHFDCITIELPGHGQSNVERDSYSVYDYAQEVSRILQHEQITACTMLGHSLGGYVVLAAYEKQLIPLEKMILAYSSEKADNDEAKAKRDKQRATIEAEGIASYVDGLIENFFAPGTDRAIVDKGRQIANTASKDGLFVALQAMKGRPDQTSLLPTIAIPTLIIEGRQDKIVQPIESDNTHIEKVYTNTGHLGMLEDPDAFAQAVIQFTLK